MRFLNIQSFKKKQYKKKKFLPKSSLSFYSSKDKHMKIILVVVIVTAFQMKKSMEVDL